MRDIIEGWIPLTAFNSANVRPVEAGTRRQLVLSETACSSELTQAAPKRPPDIDHVAIVVGKGVALLENISIIDNKSYEEAQMKHLRRVLQALPLLVVGYVDMSAQQQSLVDVAKKADEERATARERQGQTAPTKVYTNKDLPAASTPASATDGSGPAALPADVRDSFTRGIKAKCAMDWPDDFRMRQFCETQQQEAFDKIRARNDYMQATADRRAIRVKCLRDWSTPGPERNGERTLIIDFKMNNFCEEQQLKALDAIGR